MLTELIKEAATEEEAKAAILAELGVAAAAKLYTLSQGGTMAIGTLMSAFLFKEKLTLKAYASIAITFIGLLIINL